MTNSGHSILSATPASESACARLRPSSSLALWLRAMKARRVSSGRLSHSAPKSHGPQLAMQALRRFSNAALRGA
jgi:hypothetical protein